MSRWVFHGWDFSVGQGCDHRASGCVERDQVEMLAVMPPPLQLRRRVVKKTQGAVLRRLAKRLAVEEVPAVPLESAPAEVSECVGSTDLDESTDDDGGQPCLASSSSAVSPLRRGAVASSAVPHADSCPDIQQKPPRRLRGKWPGVAVSSAGRSDFGPVTDEEVMNYFEEWIGDSNLQPEDLAHARLGLAGVLGYWAGGNVQVCIW